MDLNIDDLINELQAKDNNNSNHSTAFDNGDDEFDALFGNTLSPPSPPPPGNTGSMDRPVLDFDLDALINPPSLNFSQLIDDHDHDMGFDNGDDNDDDSEFPEVNEMFRQRHAELERLNHVAITERLKDPKKPLHPGKPVELREYLRFMPSTPELDGGGGGDITARSNSSSNSTNSSSAADTRIYRLLYLNDTLIFDVVRHNIVRGSMLDLHLMAKWYMNWLHYSKQLDPQARILANLFPVGLDMVLYHLVHPHFARTRDFYFRDTGEIEYTVDEFGNEHGTRIDNRGIDTLDTSRWVMVRDDRYTRFGKWAEKNLRNDKILLSLIHRITYDLEMARRVMTMDRFDSAYRDEDLYSKEKVDPDISFAAMVTFHGIPRVMMRHLAIAYKTACTTDNFVSNEACLMNSHLVDIDYKSHIKDPHRMVNKLTTVHRVQFGVRMMDNHFTDQHYAWVGEEIPVGLLFFLTTCWNTQMLLHEAHKANISTSTTDEQKKIATELFQKGIDRDPESQVLFQLYHLFFDILKSCLRNTLRHKVINEIGGTAEEIKVAFQRRYLFYCLFGCTPEWLISHMEHRPLDQWRVSTPGRDIHHRIINLNNAY